MIFNELLKEAIAAYEPVKLVQDQIEHYFHKNTAARAYTKICQENNWPLVFDHLTIRTHDIEKASHQVIHLGWKYDETIEYKNEGWWAKVFRHSHFAPFFIDESYPDAANPIIKRWVDHFGDQGLHHIAVRTPDGVEIEEVVHKLELRDIHFPGKITGPQGTRLRQIFSQAEVIDGVPYSVLELAQRNKDPKTGKVYEGFISVQADSLMKDSTL